ncbi:hypothetical protein DYB25_012975 [Aphanomyces astaci]|uniref:Cof-like hydrolase n=1 Tax=Aphanomyces astaci TaxID=112090 RepID=A0A397BTW5_APHAT|nr:hypothetical protein DYB25_012975 [Aphanomyces astaci]RHY73963.1 hypothetical protein DYB38_013192 [Aphanomyces astaci]
MARLYSLLALDLDGTLLNASSRVTARTAAAIQRVAATGAVVSLCSGRSIACMADSERQLGLAHPCTILSCNGAAAFDSHRRPLYVDTMSVDSVRSVLRAAEDMHRCVNLYDEVRGIIHVRPSHPAHHDLIHRYSTRTGAQFNIVPAYDLDAVAPCQVAVLGDDPAAIHAALVDQVSADLQVNSYSYFVECVPRHINKGVGLHRLAQHLQIPIAETVAFGDGANDLEFVEAAGMGIAMQNAIPSVKRAANKVTEHSHDDDGVAVELEGMLARGLFGLRLEQVSSYLG